MLWKFQKAFLMVLPQICTYKPEEDDQTSKTTNGEKYVLNYTLVLIAFMYFTIRFHGRVMQRIFSYNAFGEECKIQGKLLPRIHLLVCVLHANKE